MYLGPQDLAVTIKLVLFGIQWQLNAKKALEILKIC